MKKYIVKTKYSFDEDTPAKAFEEEAAAKDFLKEQFLQELGIDVRENEYETEATYSAVTNYATIKNYFVDRVDITEFYIEEEEDA